MGYLSLSHVICVFGSIDSVILRARVLAPSPCIFTVPPHIWTHFYRASDPPIVYCSTTKITSNLFYPPTSASSSQRLSPSSANTVFLTLFFSVGVVYYLLLRWREPPASTLSPSPRSRHRRHLHHILCSDHSHAWRRRRSGQRRIGRQSDTTAAANFGGDEFEALGSSLFWVLDLREDRYETNPDLLLDELFVFFF